jgi:hypothetical protein
MRFLGVLIIMVAHSEPPEWIFQLRNFGSPLLVVASALTSAAIYKYKSIDIMAFYRKRLSKLVFPAWIFLTFYFAIVYVFCLLINKPFFYSKNTLLSSYLFTDGIGYVWILKIYITLALITPFALKFVKQNQTNKAYFYPIVFAYVLYELLVFWGRIYFPELSETALPVIAYSLLFLYGLKMNKFTSQQLLTVSFVSLAIFLLFVLYNFYDSGKFVQTQKYKYPPSLYYLSYSLFWINIVYILCRKVLHNWIPPVFAEWFSSNSLWVYLWHIMAIFIWNKILSDSIHFDFESLVKFVFILSFGVTATLLQNTLVMTFLANSESSFLRNLSALLSGNNSPLNQNTVQVQSNYYRSKGNEVH